MVNGKKFVGYFENWAQYRLRGNGRFFPEQIDASLFTHINFAFGIFGFVTWSVKPDKPEEVIPGEARFTGDYTLQPVEWNDTVDEYEDPISHQKRLGLYQALKDLKQTNSDLKTLLSLGGWSFNSCDDTPESAGTPHPFGPYTCRLFSDMTSTAEGRKQFIDSAIGYAHKYGFDGIDIDWEYPGDRTRGGADSDFDNFLSLLKEFREAIPNSVNPNFLLTIASPAIPKGQTKTPEDFFEWLAKCASYLDWLNVMSYDYHGAFDNPKLAGVNAPLKTDTFEGSRMFVRQTVEDYLASGIPRDKIMLGLPTYGRSVTLDPIVDFASTQPGQPFDQAGPAGVSTQTPGVLAYYEITSGLDSGELSRGWDERTSTPYAYNSTNGAWISYDDPASLALKGEYAGEQRLGGIMFWAIGLDDFANGYPLIRAANQAFLETKPSFSDLFSRTDMVEIGAESPSIAANDDGLVISAFTIGSELWVRLGQHGEEGVRWLSQSIKASDRGTEPSLAINNQGNVLLVFEKLGTNDLYYRVGYTDSWGISWSGSEQKYGEGIRPYVALSEANLMVETHQRGFEIWRQQMVYSSGMVSNGTIDFLVHEEEYDAGREPAIALIEQDSITSIVEIHMGNGILEKLWIRVGDVETDGRIHWRGGAVEYAADERYTYGKQSSISATTDGYILEVHRSDGEYANLWYRVGQFDQSAGRVNWINNLPIKYATGEHPYVALARTETEYILVETHGADVFYMGEDEDERPPKFVSIRTNIPLVQELIEERSFFERVGVDLGSNGLSLSEDGEQLNLYALEVEPSHAEMFFNKLKLIVTFIPFIGDIVSIVANSVACQDGETEGCRDLGMDIAFLGLSLVPGAALVKGTGKAFGSAIEGITRAARGMPIDDLIRKLDQSSELSSLGRWWRKRQEARANIDLPTHFPCLGLAQSLPRSVPLSVNALASNTDESVNLLMSRLAASSQQMTSTRDNNQIPTLDLSDLLNESSKERLVEQYNMFIKGLRDDFNNSRGMPNLKEETFPRQIIINDKTLVLEFKKSDLYIVKAGPLGDVKQLTDKEQRYVDKKKPLEVNGERIVTDFKHLMDKNFATMENGAIKGTSEHLRHYIGLFSESARFGLVRQLFAEVLRFPRSRSFELANVHNLLDAWAKLNDRLPGPGDPKHGRVGIDDPELKYSGDGHAYNSHFSGVNCKMKRY